jgi:magnesium transporter
MSASAGGEDERKLNLELVEHQGLVWLHVEKPTEAETEYIEQRFSLRHVDLDDILRRHIRPKIDENTSHLFIALQLPVYDEETHTIDSCELDVIIGTGYLVTVDCLGRFRDLAKFLQKCQIDETTRKENMCHGAGHLLYIVLRGMINRRLSLLDRIGDSIEDVERKIFSDKSKGTVKEISILSRNIITFRRAIGPLKTIINTLGTKIGPYSEIDLKESFRDLASQLERIWDALDECKEVTEELQNTYNSLSTNRTNDILRILTVVMTIGTILTVYVGFYGMNIPLGPLGGADPGGNPLAWLWLMVIGVVLTVVMIVYSIRKGWL